MRQPAVSVSDPREAGPVAIRSGLAEAGNPQQHEPWIDLAERVPAEPPGLQLPGPEILRDHVRAGRQPLEHLSPARIPKVERQRTLVPRFAFPGEAVAVLRRGAVAPPRVTAPGLLDLDDLRAELGHQRRSEGRGDKRGEVENADAFERGFARFVIWAA